MKIRSINQQQNFRGIEKPVGDFVIKHQKLLGGIAGLAGASVAAQKLITTAGEVTIAPKIDIGTGKILTKLSGETDGRTNKSSETQAIRTKAQAIGGTITGIIIRLGCIAASTALLMKAGKDAGSAVGQYITNKGKISPDKIYEYQKNAQAWGKNVGGFAATIIMFATNFLLDAPLINWFNKKFTEIDQNKKSAQQKQNIQESEVK